MYFSLLMSHLVELVIGLIKNNCMHGGDFTQPQTIYVNIGLSWGQWFIQKTCSGQTASTPLLESQCAVMQSKVITLPVQSTARQAFL